MSYTVVYASKTGNTAFLANSLAEALPGQDIVCKCSNKKSAPEDAESKHCDFLCSYVYHSVFRRKSQISAQSGLPCSEILLSATGERQARFLQQNFQFFTFCSVQCAQE